MRTERNNMTSAANPTFYFLAPVVFRFQNTGPAPFYLQFDKAGSTPIRQANYFPTKLEFSVATDSLGPLCIIHWHHSCTLAEARATYLRRLSRRQSDLKKLITAKVKRDEDVSEEREKLKDMPRLEQLAKKMTADQFLAEMEGDVKFRKRASFEALWKFDVIPFSASSSRVSIGKICVKAEFMLGDREAKRTYYKSNVAAYNDDLSMSESPYGIYIYNANLSAVTEPRNISALNVNLDVILRCPDWPDATRDLHRKASEIQIWNPQTGTSTTPLTSFKEVRFQVRLQRTARVFGAPGNQSNASQDIDERWLELEMIATSLQERMKTIKDLQEGVATLAKGIGAAHANTNALFQLSQVIEQAQKDARGYRGPGLPDKQILDNVASAATALRDKLISVHDPLMPLQSMDSLDNRSPVALLRQELLAFEKYTTNPLIQSLIRTRMEEEPTIKVDPEKQYEVLDGIGRCMDEYHAINTSFVVDHGEYLKKLDAFLYAQVGRVSMTASTAYYSLMWGVNLGKAFKALPKLADNADFVRKLAGEKPVLAGKLAMYQSVDPAAIVTLRAKWSLEGFSGKEQFADFFGKRGGKVDDVAKVLKMPSANLEALLSDFHKEVSSRSSSPGHQPGPAQQKLQAALHDRLQTCSKSPMILSSLLFLLAAAAVGESWWSADKNEWRYQDYVKLSIDVCKFGAAFAQVTGNAAKFATTERRASAMINIFERGSKLSKRVDFVGAVYDIWDGTSTMWQAAVKGVEVDVPLLVGGYLTAHAGWLVLGGIAASASRLPHIAAHFGAVALVLSAVGSILKKGDWGKDKGRTANLMKSLLAGINGYTYHYGNTATQMGGLLGVVEQMRRLEIALEKLELDFVPVPITKLEEYRRLLHNVGLESTSEGIFQTYQPVYDVDAGLKPGGP